MKKLFMTKDHLNLCNVSKIGTIEKGVMKEVVKGANLSAPGFYFLVKEDDGLVYTRYYVGRQRNKRGFTHIASKIRRMDSGVNACLYEGGLFDVYFLPHTDMKEITNAFGKGALKTFMTRRHSDDFQNLEELNRMLSDNFRFVLQAY